MLHATITSSLYQLSVHPFIKILTDTVKQHWREHELVSSASVDFLHKSTCVPQRILWVHDGHWACAVHRTSQGKRLFVYLHNNYAIMFTLCAAWPPDVYSCVQVFTHQHLNKLFLRVRNNDFTWHSLDFKPTLISKQNIDNIFNRLATRELLLKRTLTVLESKNPHSSLSVQGFIFWCHNI